MLSSQSSDPAGKLGGMSDTVLHLRSLVRDPLKEAYGIAKSMAKTNVKLKSMLAPIIDFYAALARTAAESRKANAEACAKGDAGAPIYTPGTCQASGGEPTGSVKPLDPFTFCCVP